MYLGAGENLKKKSARTTAVYSQQEIRILYCVLFLVSFVSCLVSEFLCFYSFSFFLAILTFRVAFFCCGAFVPGTLRST